MNKKIILFNNNTFPKNFLLKLKKKFKKLEFLILKDKDHKKLLRNIKKANVLINCPRKYFTEELVKKFHSLEWVHTSAAGVDEFINPLFSKSNIIFTNGRILQGPEIADHTLGLILTFSRNLNFYYNFSRIKKVSRPIELNGKRALLIGFGGVGKCIAERLKSFGVVIDVVSEELPAMTNDINIYFSNVNLNKIAKNYDIVISAAPLTIKTKKLFDYIFFKSMKKGSIFINISRGGLVDTKALTKKKIFKKFLGIGLDVTDPEPLPKQHILRKQSNVIITDHTAGLSDKNRLRAYNFIYDNINRYYNNQILLNQVNKVEGY